MTRFILPAILIAAAIGLFVIYTNPLYNSTKDLSLQNASYDDALNKSSQLHTLRDQLLAKRNTFSNDDVTKLQHVLPDNVDNIRLIIDINNIASRHNLALTNVVLGNVSDTVVDRTALAVGASGDPVGSVEVEFSVAASYDNFLAFLADLEHSLRIVDVTKVTFTTGTGDLNSYDLKIRTYWLH